jgi:cell wall-associated NlpC family hydrolase
MKQIKIISNNDKGMLPIRKEMELDTGDLLLFRGNSLLSYLLEFIGHSKYSHVGIIIKNPSFLHDSLEDGLYVWDASYGYTPEVEHNEIRYGVQIHKLDDILPLYQSHSVYVRKLHIERTDEMKKMLKKVHEEVHAKPYNLHIMDWIAAKYNMDHPLPPLSMWKHTSRFWCSALVAYIYHEMGWIEDVNWSLVAPREFSSNETTGMITFTCNISVDSMLQK